MTPSSNWRRGRPVGDDRRLGGLRLEAVELGDQASAGLGPQLIDRLAFDLRAGSSTGGFTPQARTAVRLWSSLGRWMGALGGRTAGKPE